MNLAAFNYDYPQELVAQHPLPTRDASRMMIVECRQHHLHHGMVTDLPQYLGAGDLLVVNDTKVVPARLFGTRPSGAAIELLVIEPAEGTARDRTRHYNVWRCLAKKAKRIRPGEKLFFGVTAQGTVSGRDGVFLLVDFAPSHLERAIERRGVPPLPPYIKRVGHEAYSAEDRERYQTIFAVHNGSAAAPTAGLHFSEKLLADLRTQGVAIATITLHVGTDTFRPVEVSDLRQHRMHGERFIIPETTAIAINTAKRLGRRVIACGTTVVRALESAWQGNECLPTAGTTTLFITPGYTFRVVNGLLTNFHQPKSTLLMLVAAFAGREFILECYRTAIAARYRLFSYGDCMFIT